VDVDQWVPRQFLRLRLLGLEAPLQMVLATAAMIGREIVIVIATTVIATAIATETIIHHVMSKFILQADNI
jgi:hypothetical protein